jgi:alcohol dehydrogenase (cytochrome c)
MRIAVVAAPAYFAGRATDADTGVWKWRLQSNYPIVGAVTPTAGGLVFFGDMGGFIPPDKSSGMAVRPRSK